jgi:hypothetical protein
MTAIVVALSVLLALAIGAAVAAFLRDQRTQAKYRPILDIDKAVAAAKLELEDLGTEQERFLARDKARRTEPNDQYNAAKQTYEKLRTEVSLLEESLEDISFGLYRPHYTFATSDKYKDELERIYGQQKAMVRAGSATACARTWSVGDSKREGERMIKQMTKVMLRAFNGEVAAAVAKVTWNNATRMEERILKAYEAINGSASVLMVTITDGYRDLALAELRLTHEYEQKLREEQEEQRQIRERIREEERAQREFEKAKEEAATEEARFEKALAKARAEVDKAKGAELDKANAKVQELEAALAEAHEKMERAKSMAELTKSGNVYVISNVGSFGEQVFKIGMTRRLDPMERVHELGDASVPFAFDVHAMMYSKDAPKLENAFHRKFDDRRLNLMNERKEFFSVSLHEIEAFAKEQGVEVEFTKLAEAREYRETLAKRLEMERKKGPSVPKPSLADMPAQLFAPAPPAPAEA